MLDEIAFKLTSDNQQIQNWLQTKHYKPKDTRPKFQKHIENLFRNVKKLCF